MRGLITKDLLILMKTAKMYVFVLAVYVLVSLLTGADYGAIIVMLFGMLSITSYALDEQAKWNGYGLTMAVTRRDMVAGKYLLALLLCLVGVVAAGIISALASLRSGGFSAGSLLLSSALSLGVSCLFVSIALPLLFKMGTEKSRMLLMVLFALPIMLITLVLSDGQEANTMGSVLEAIKSYSWAFPLGGLGVMGVSYIISLGIFEKKDF